MSEQRVVILGATGMLGRAVARELSGATKYTSQHYDFRYQHAVAAFGETLEPSDIVVNCVGHLRQNMPKQPIAQDVHDAFMLNAYLPRYIAPLCCLIHPSTDCVFSGTGGAPYFEDDLPDGEDEYARTKMLGDCPDRAMVLRTSIIGIEQRGFKGLMAWFLQQNQAKGFFNHRWNGVTTNVLAKIIRRIIEDDHWEPGLWHIHSPSPKNKFDLLNFINRHRTNKAVLESCMSPIGIDRCLTTEKSLEETNWWRSLVPEIEDQIAEAMRVG